jgi:hypothetical protein
MRDARSTLPPGFPLAARDRFDESIAVGDSIRILAVTSCLKGLPEADKARLRTIVGKIRTIAGIDQHGFVWLCFDELDATADFSLFPAEVTRALSWSGLRRELPGTT